MSNPTTTATTTTSGSGTNLLGLPPIKHVFIIMLADQGYSQSFASHDQYLAKTLPKQGRLIQYFYSVAGGELADEIALVGGQGPTRQTETDCAVFANVKPAAKGKRDRCSATGACIRVARRRSRANSPPPT